jgi:hypothetical protein
MGHGQSRQRASRAPGLGSGTWRDRNRSAARRRTASTPEMNSYERFRDERDEVRSSIALLLALSPGAACLRLRLRLRHTGTGELETVEAGP